MKIYVKASSLAEATAHQRNIPKYILNNPSVNKVIEILKECKDSVPDVQSKLEMFYRRPGQGSVYGENVSIWLHINYAHIPEADIEWDNADVLNDILDSYINTLKALPDVIRVDKTSIGPYVALKISKTYKS